MRCARLFSLIVDRSPLLVAISSGKAPKASRILREKSSAAADVTRSAGGTRYWRNHLKPPDDYQRVAALERVFTGRFASLMVARSAEAEKALQDELDKPESRDGIPFWPRRAGRCRAADPAVCRRSSRRTWFSTTILVTQPVLELVRCDAEPIALANAPASTAPQHETNQLLVEAKAGKTVVRLKGGDPFIFGRGAAAAGRRRGGDPVPWCRASPQPPGRRPTPVFR